MTAAIGRWSTPSGAWLATSAHRTAGCWKPTGCCSSGALDLLAVLDVSSDDLDTVVRPGDLPTKPLTVDARELRAREHDFERLLGRIAEQAERLSQARGTAAAAAEAVEQARRARGRRYVPRRAPSR